MQTIENTFLKWTPQEKKTHLYNRILKEIFNQMYKEIKGELEDFRICLQDKHINTAGSKPHNKQYRKLSGKQL